MVHHPLRLNIDGDALVSNWRWLARESGAAACGAAVKADGYGLGARAVVERLGEAGCRTFFVATWAEAEALMPWPDAFSLLVLHGVGPDDLDAAMASPARPVLNSAAQVARWLEQAPGRPCNLMVDTGMNRLGVSPEEAQQAIAGGLALETLMSHLACADEPDHMLNEVQLRRFDEIRRAIPAQRYSLANSAGICLGARYAFDLTRPGLALYGGIPVPGDARQEAALRSVARIEAQLVQIRDVPGGESVGYGAIWTAPSARRIGILNIGYADGYLRALGAAGRVTAGDRAFTIVGRVSMDLVAVDLGEESTGLTEGDWMAVDFDLPRLAAASRLSQYELLTTLGRRYERRWC